MILHDLSKRKTYLESTTTGKKNARSAYNRARKNPNKQTIRDLTTAVSESNDAVIFYHENVLNLIQETECLSEAERNVLLRDYKTAIVPRLDIKTTTKFLKEHSDIFTEAEIERIKTVDRILINDKALSNRFNFGSVLKTPYSIESNIMECCNLLDTYEISKEAKYNIALENVVFSLYENKVNIDPKIAASIITEYFLFNSTIMTDMDKAGMQKVLENNVIETEYVNSIHKWEGKSFIDYRHDLVAQCSSNCDNEIKEMIYSIENIKTEADASKYMDKVYKYILAHREENSCAGDLYRLFISIFIIPLHGKVSKDFICAEFKLLDMRYPDNNIANKFDTIEVSINNGELADFAKVLDDGVAAGLDKTMDLYSDTMQEAASFYESLIVEASEDVKDVLDKFKTDQNKSLGKFKTILNKIFAKSPEEIIDETPRILGMLRYIFILGTVTIPGIGPIVAVVALIVNAFISMHLNVKQTAKLLTAFRQEIKITEERIEAGRGDVEELEKYKKALEDALEKIENYRSSIVDDYDLKNNKLKAEEDRVPEDEDDYVPPKEDEESDDLDDDFDWDDDETDLDESARFAINKYVIENSLNVLLEEKEILNRTIEDATAPTLSDMVKDLIDPHDQVFNSITYMENSMENFKDPVNVYKNISEFTGFALLEAYIEEVDKNDVKEKGMSFLNTFNLVIQNFKGKVKNLSMKEKQLWQTIDVNLSGLKRSIEKALTNDRREAIIKGSVIPSFSKLIKQAMVVAGASAIFTPIGGAITAFAMFSTSKALNLREKQMLYDEIDTELIVIEKELQLAENESDMQKYRFLLRMQRKLQRERQRIKYGMRVKGRDIPSVPNSNHDY